MAEQKKPFLLSYFRIALALLLTIFLFRVFEYVAIASKSFTHSAWRFEVLGLLYDSWFWMIWCGILYFPLFLIAKKKEKASKIIFHSMYSC